MDMFCTSCIGLLHLVHAGTVPAYRCTRYFVRANSIVPVDFGTYPIYDRVKTTKSATNETSEVRANARVRPGFSSAGLGATCLKFEMIYD